MKLAFTCLLTAVFAAQSVPSLAQDALTTREQEKANRAAALAAREAAEMRVENDMVTMRRSHYQPA